jgi:hypothetical chaperone protein
MSVAGIDFGTSNSLIATADGSARVVVHRVDPENHVPELLPSLLFFHRLGRASVGWQAWLDQRALEDESDGRFIRALKSALPEFSAGEAVRIFGRRYELPELASLLIRRLLQAAQAERGEPISAALLGRPVRFGETPQQDARAQEALQEAAELAGIRPLGIMYEPEAVIRYFFAVEGRGQNASVTALVFDFGGGTLDLCLARCDRERACEILATSGVRIGGTTLDRRLFEEKVLDHLGRGCRWGPGLELPNALLHRLVNPDETWRLTDAEHARLALHVLNATRAAGHRRPELEALQSVTASRKGPEIFRAIESAKIALSEVPVSPIHFHFGPLQLDEPLDRPGTRELFAAELEQIDRLIHDTLASAGLSSGAVDVVLLAGGSSNLHCVQELLRDRFGPERVPVRDDLFTSVARGLAISAAERG